MFKYLINRDLFDFLTLSSCAEEVVWVFHWKQLPDAIEAYETKQQPKTLN